MRASLAFPFLPRITRETAAGILLLLNFSVLTADEAPAANRPPILLPAVRAEAESESDHFIQGPFLPEVQGARINAGKKTTILDFDAQPRINGNNYRQALAQSPGLILSEENSPLVSKIGRAHV